MRRVRLQLTCFRLWLLLLGKSPALPTHSLGFSLR